ncbi:MAG: acyl-CoA thioester hydrolase [Flavobacteriales bacterium]
MSLQEKSKKTLNKVVINHKEQLDIFSFWNTRNKDNNMYTTETKIRVRYSETDKMGFCYYGNYAQYFEVARVEAMRSLGVSYKSLEDDGILMPVIEFNIKYKKPAHYDDELIIKCQVPELPSSRILFNYQTYKSDDLLNEAHTSLVFISKENNRPIRTPNHLLDKIKPYFN